MAFHSPFLLLLVLGAPVLMFCAAFGIYRKIGKWAERQAKPPAGIAKPRATYFYPTRDLDGNDTGYW